LIPQYVRTRITDGEHLQSGEIVNVQIQEMRGGELFGVLAN
jgi:hypothetical protein